MNSKRLTQKQILSGSAVLGAMIAACAAPAIAQSQGPFTAAQATAGAGLYQSTCAACHGAEGKGNKALGAPNLTDDVWLYGSSEATIVHSILNGRNNRMPAQEQTLTSEQIRLVAAWVWGLSKGVDVTSVTVTSARAK